MKSIFQCIICGKKFNSYHTKKKLRITCSIECKTEYMRRIRGGFDKVSKRLLRKTVRKVS